MKKKELQVIQTLEALLRGELCRMDKKERYRFARKHGIGFQQIELFIAGYHLRSDTIERLAGALVKECDV